MEVSALIRPYFNNLGDLIPGRNDLAAGIYMDSDESLLNKEDGLNLLPDFSYSKLTGKVAEIYGTSSNQVYLSNGKDEIIDLLTKIACEAGKDNVLVFPPTELTHHRFAEESDVYVQLSPLDDDYEIDLDTAFNAINSATKLMILSNPNLITGQFQEPEYIYQLFKGFPHKLVVVDESLIDFSEGKSFLEDIDQYQNLIVIRSFSNSWGLAGLNVAAAFAHPYIVGILNKVRYAYNLNTPTIQALHKALGKPEERNEIIRKIQEERKFLMEELIKLKVTEKLFESRSNKILVRFKKPNQLHEFLLKNNILIRNYTSSVFSRNCLRITIGTREQNRLLINKIKAFQEETYIQ